MEFSEPHWQVNAENIHICQRGQPPWKSRYGL